jgi:hypothetical protein
MSLAGYIIIISMAVVNYIYTHRHAEIELDNEPVAIETV